ncbi:unnamed protein product [Protopolystoma xenopodis]|uniref:Uncharacterized protein n=1 Tax=Protopolystoma xenopodis TaxID=117903 RepID=A0A448XFJ1_9PLAT|nr:unnamed protein product [Protopolystoma xenopodis]
MSSNFEQISPSLTVQPLDVPVLPASGNTTRGLSARASPSNQRDLSGGTGVFANFFDEMAEAPSYHHSASLRPDVIQSPTFGGQLPDDNITIENKSVIFSNDDDDHYEQAPTFPMQAFFTSCADDDLAILNQFGDLHRRDQLKPDCGVMNYYYVSSIYS